MIGRCKKKSENQKHVTSDKNRNVYLGWSMIKKGHFKIMFTKEKDNKTLEQMNML